MAYIFSLLGSGGIIESFSDSAPLSASLRVSVNMFPTPNCANVITLPVYSFEDVAYRVYVTALFGRDGDASGSDISTVCYVFERTNWQCNYVCTV